MNEASPDLLASVKWWWSLFLVPMGVALRWLIELVTGNTTKALASQSEIMARTERDLLARDKRIAELEQDLRNLRRDYDELNDKYEASRNELHDLRDKLNTLLGQQEWERIKASRAAEKGS